MASHSSEEVVRIGSGIQDDMGDAMSPSVALLRNALVRFGADPNVSLDTSLKLSGVRLASEAGAYRSDQICIVKASSPIMGNLSESQPLVVISDGKTVPKRRNVIAVAGGCLLSHGDRVRGIHNRRRCCIARLLGNKRIGKRGYLLAVRKDGPGLHQTRPALSLRQKEPSLPVS